MRNRLNFLDLIFFVRAGINQIIEMRRIRLHIDLLDVENYDDSNIYTKF